MSSDESKVKAVLSTVNGRRSNGDNNARQRTNGKHTNGDSNRKRHNSADSEVSIQSMEKYIPTPPDGGWGWVIVVCSLVANLIVDGIGYTFGVFLMEFVEVFDEPKSKISLAGSLLCGVYLFAGPVVSAMTNKWGCRPVVIAGSCLATVAFVLASFSPNANVLIITYGAMGGFGFGMIYLPAIVSVGFYFEKNRAFATGLAVSGSGLGTFIFPPLTEVLLQAFAWRGTLLIIAGIILQGCIFGALMRPLEPILVPKTQKEEKLENEAERDSVAFVKRTSSTSEGNRHPSESIPVPGADDRKYKLSVGSSYTGSVGSPARNVSGLASSPPPGSLNGETPTIVVDNSVESQLTSPDTDGESKVANTVDVESPTDDTSTEKSVYFTPPESNPNSPVKSPTDEHDGQGDTVMELVSEKSLNHREPQSKGENGYTRSMTQFNHEFAPLLEVPSPVFRKPSGGQQAGYGGSRTNMLHITSLHSLHMSNMDTLHVSKKDLARPLYRKDIFYSGSVINIPQFQSQPDIKNYITSITTIPGEMDLVDTPSSSSKCVNACCGCLPRSAKDTLSEMGDFSLLKDVSFMFICLGNFTAFLGFYIPFMFLVDRAVSMGIEKTSAAFLISIIGITNTIGRIAVGKLADLKIVDSLVITYVAIFVMAVVTALIPFCNTYALLATNAAIFGLGMSAYISLSSIIICDRLGLEKLTNGFGLLSMVRGTAGMIGPPFAGWLFDASGSYDLSFFLGGFLIFFGGICHVLLHLPCVKRKSASPQQTIVLEEMPFGGMGSRPQIVSVEEAMTLT